MHVEVYGLEHIDNQELYDYHERIVEQFKNEYRDAFWHERTNAGSVIAEFEYNPETYKMTLKSINRLKHVHHRITTVNPKIIKWFN